MAKIWWAALLERNIMDHAVQSLMDVAMQAGQRGHVRLRWPYSRTDLARNELVKLFLQESHEPDDVFVMLDDDHLFPPDILDRLTKWNKDVVGALAFRRGQPFFPCFFMRAPNGAYGIVSEWEPGLMECALVGTGAIAIRRRVFEQLADAGYPWPFFRYVYPRDDTVMPSEDVYFSQCCERAGIIHHVDTTFCIPHMALAVIDQNSWTQWQEDHPELKEGKGDWMEMMKPGYKVLESGNGHEAEPAAS